MWLEISEQTQNTNSDCVSVTMEWSREKTAQLIEIYRGYPLLWDPTHALYKHRFKRADAWREIAENIQMERDEVEKKMKNLVTQFRRELKKSQEKKSGDGTEDAYKSQWFAFSIMLFLADKHKLHKTYDAGFQVRNCMFVYYFFFHIYSTLIWCQSRTFVITGLHTYYCGFRKYNIIEIAGTHSHIQHY